MADVPVTATLLEEMAAKRARLDRFIARSLPRKRRLLNITIVGGSLAAALTAGPAVGGASLTQWLTVTFGLTAPAWQILCAGAAVASIAATLATQLLKSHNLDEHVTRAQSCRARLEAIELSLRAGLIDPPRAASEYLRCVEESAFLDAV